MLFDAYNLGFSFRPLEPTFLQTFVPETETISVPVEDLDYGVCSIAETKILAGQRIVVELFGNQDGEAINGLAHISAAGGKIDLTMALSKEHQRCSSTASNRLKVCSEK